MFQPGLCFSAEFNKSNNCYAFVTENGLTPCEPNFMINLGLRAPPGQLKAICLCIKPTHTRLQFHPQYAQGFFRDSAMRFFPFSISALNDSADLPLETPNDSARRSEISLLGSSIKRAFLFVLGHGNKKASIAEV